MHQKVIQLPLLQIAGSVIEFIDNFNFLGITINKHLNWSNHIDKLSAKICKTIGVLNSLKHVLPNNIKRTIYNSLIVCHLNYGILLWGSQLKIDDKLHKLQKKAVRILLLNFITDSLYTYAGIYGSCPNQRKILHYRDKLLQNTARHEHIAAPSSGNVFLKSIQCWRRVTLSQWYY